MTQFRFAVCCFILCLANLSLAQPNTDEKKTSAVADDLFALTSRRETRWDLQGTQGQTVTLTLRKNNFGRGSNMFALSVTRRTSPTETNQWSSGFTATIAEKEGRRYLSVAGEPFEAAGADSQIPYTLEGNILRLEGGKAKIGEAGLIDLKGDWKRTVVDGSLLKEGESPPAQPRPEQGFSFNEFTSEAGRFTVLLPRRPIEKKDSAGEGLTEFVFYSPVSRQLVFTVKYLDLPEKLVAGRDPQELLKMYRKGYRGGKTILDDKEVSNGKSKIPGRDYRLQAEPEFFVRERLFLDGNRLYTLYIGAEDQAFLNSEAANRYFDSFVISSGTQAN